MKTTSFLPLLPIASGLVTPHEKANPWHPGEPRWLMYNFHFTGTGEQEDRLFFNLTSDPGSFETPVSAECEVLRAWHNWQPCSMLIAGSADGNRGLWVMPLPTTTAINIQIRHSFVQKSDNVHTFYNLTGNFSANWQGVTFPTDPTAYPSRTEKDTYELIFTDSEVTI